MHYETAIELAGGDSRTVVDTPWDVLPGERVRWEDGTTGRHIDLTDSAFAPTVPSSEADRLVNEVLAVEGVNLAEPEAGGDTDLSDEELAEILAQAEAEEAMEADGRPPELVAAEAALNDAREQLAVATAERNAARAERRAADFAATIGRSVDLTRSDDEGGDLAEAFLALTGQSSRYRGGTRISDEPTMAGIAGDPDYLSGPVAPTSAGSSPLIDAYFDETGNPRPVGTPVQARPWAHGPERDPGRW